MRIGNPREDELTALDELIDLLDKAATLTRAGKFAEANLRVEEAVEMGKQIRGTEQKYPH